MPSIKELETRKAEIVKELDAFIGALETEKRTATKEENKRQTSLLSDHKAVTKSIKTKKAEAELREKVAKVLPAGVAPVGPVFTELRTEPYRVGGTESYYVDLERQTRGDAAARDRLIVNDRYRDGKMALETRGETTTTGAGGEFAPPLWAIDQFVALARPNRTTADLVRNLVLPQGVSQMNLPKIATGTLTASQTSQNSGISVQDITTSSVSSNVTTVAGGAVIAQQLLDQSPISMDQVITADLARDLAGKIDSAVIAAIAAATGNSITYTNTTPTSLLFGTFVQQGIDQVLLGNFKNPDAVVMRPDRWGRLLAYGDTAGRPLVVPNASYGLMNGVGVANGVQAQGAAGTYRGVNVYLDPLIPNTLGAGSNQDEVFVLDSQQVFLYESAPKIEAFRETYANQLSLFVRLYEYYAIIANRLPKAISTITGTGMIPGSYGN